VLRLLIVDNYDSFTYNLAHAAAAITGEMPVVVRNDESTWEEIRFDAVIISPGPGHPANARDFGICSEVIRCAKVPVLGVCLGHQGIAMAFGGAIGRVEPAHGQVSRIEHNGDDLFRGIPAQFDAVRYHSLAVLEPLPPELRKIAWSEDGAVMAIRHATRPLWGVQFHPESILTEQGPPILRNFLSTAGNTPTNPAPPYRAAAGTCGGRRSRHAAPDAAAKFRKLHAHNPYCYWLDRGPNPIMGSATEIISYDAATKTTTITTEGHHEHRNQTLFDYLDESFRENPSDPAFPFGGGYVGYFGYELRQDCGSPVTHASPFPDAMLMRIGAPSTLPPDRRICKPQPRLTHSEYLEAIQQCLTHLREGEAYELCLTTQIDLESAIPALRYYEALRELNPAPYSAYLRFNDLEIACSSPECFLRIDPNGRIESRPIKGTIARGRTEEEDATLRRELATNPRYRAENLMITDLVRHDLGRVAQPGSVEVPGLMEVESYATVHQLVSTITAQLRPGATVVDCLRAAFPGGSMTGAPKLRAMEILDKLEPCARGIYSGSIGYIGFDGSADLNIVIRTAVFHNGRVSIGTGGAILTQSDPAAEWEEAQLKAAALFRALGVA
jgi:para-aminobenzoate synthetase